MSFFFVTQKKVLFHICTFEYKFLPFDCPVSNLYFLTQYCNRKINEFLKTLNPELKSCNKIKTYLKITYLIQLVTINI